MFNDEDYTIDQLQAAREYAATVSRKGLDSVIANAVNPVTSDYIDKCENSIRDILAGKCDFNFTIRQRMEYHLTGTATPFINF